VTPEADRYLDKARQSLAHARTILAIDLGEDAGRAAYLGAFHAAQAFIFERTKQRRQDPYRSPQFLKLVRDEPRIDVELRRFLSEGYKLKENYPAPKSRGSACAGHPRLASIARRRGCAEQVRA